MSTFTVGLTRDLLTTSGDPSFGKEALRILDGEPGLSWEFMPESVSEITPAILGRYDAVLVNAPRVSRASFGNGNVRTRILARHGVGYDSVDVPACTEHGVVLTNQPDGVRRPVAVAALTFIMALSQHLFTKDRLTRAGRWNERTDFMGMGLIGRTLGIVGAGSIGREIMRLAKPFGLRLIAADPYASAESVAAEGAELTDLATVMKESDFIVVVCLLTPETHHLIGAEQFAMMKKTAYFINVARGPIMDEVALTAALNAGQLAGAGLDVFEQEPVDPNNPLLKMDNVIVTPHSLCWTDECFRGLAESAMTSIVAVKRGERPRNVVNPDVIGTERVKSWLK